MRNSSIPGATLPFKASPKADNDVVIRTHRVVAVEPMKQAANDMAWNIIIYGFGAVILLSLMAFGAWN